MSKQLNRAAAGGSAEPAALAGAELSAVFVACNERLIDLQKQAVDIAFAEAAAIQSAWVAAASVMFGLLPQPSDRANTARLVDIAGAWLRVVGQTQTAWLELVAGANAGAPAGTRERRSLPERRRMAVVINFPDRRRAVS